MRLDIIRFELFITSSSIIDLVCYTHFMIPLFADTTPEMEKLYLSLLKQASPAKKMEMLTQLNAAANELAMCGLRKRHPDASQEQLKRMLAALLLGEDLAKKVYGDLEDA